MTIHRIAVIPGDGTGAETLKASGHWMRRLVSFQLTSSGSGSISQAATTT